MECYSYTITYEGRSYPTKGHAVSHSPNKRPSARLTIFKLWVVHQCMGRNDRIFPQPAEFNPNRFLDGTEIPNGALRPFERGPRNCIGQALAMLEIKLALVFLCRRFDFTMGYDKKSPSVPFFWWVCLSCNGVCPHASAGDTHERLRSQHATSAPGTSLVITTK
jgi:hypothetical protein